MVAITRPSRSPEGYTLHCTGFLIDRKHAIVAAHTKNDDFIGWYRARIGNTNYKKGDVYRITEVVTHTGYSKGMFYDDIAILTLDREVYSPGFNPICLPDKELSTVSFVGREMTLAGWSENKQYKETAEELQQLTGYTAIDNRRCQRLLQQILRQTFQRIFPDGLDEGILCAKFKDETEKSCLFHSGVPLMFNYRHRWFAIGFISFGVCVNKEAPEGFTNIIHHLEWIKANTQVSVQPTFSDESEDPQPRSDCGDSKHEHSIHGLILGGERARGESWPWMVAIRKRTVSGNFEPSCGGALIDRRHVLSAAHCYNPQDKNWYRARIGSINQNVAEEYRFSRIAIHEGYTEDKFYDDIAILTLDRDVDFQHYNPICLPDQYVRRLDFTGRTAAVAGWGIESIRSGSWTTYLNQLIGLPIMSNRRCQSTLSNFTRTFYREFPRGIDRSFICAAFAESGKDSCAGDSGGPLMFLNGNRWYAIGIVSFGTSCGLGGIPAGYTNVSNYLDWIRDNARN